MTEPRKAPDDKVEDFAIFMALCANGGHWDTHYTDAQRDLWCKRARIILEGHDD